MIYLELSGGMGNQLFEYAMARQVLELVRKERPKEKITLIQTRYNKDVRNYSLNNFCIDASIRLIPKWKQKILELYYKTKKHLIMILKTEDKKLIRGQKSFETMIKYGMFCTTDVFDYYEYKIPKKKVIYIYGNFQSLKYFSNVESIIRQEYKVKREKVNVSDELLALVENENSVAVHIRRGDYLNTEWEKSLNICDEHYYSEAIRYIISKVDNPVFYVFSNGKEDLNWIKENMNLPGNIKYIDQDGSEIDDFYLMSHCKHHIISNSTYSWWTSFLAENKQKIVIAPSEWYRTDDQHADDIYLDNWKIIKII